MKDLNEVDCVIFDPQLFIPSRTNQEVISTNTSSINHKLINVFIYCCDFMHETGDSTAIPGVGRICRNSFKLSYNIFWKKKNI